MHTLYERKVRNFAASEMHFKSIPMLGGLTQHLWVRPHWFLALHVIYCCYW